MQSFDTQTGLPADQFLLRAIAEELKLPLNRIARSAELGDLLKDEEDISNHLKLIETDTKVAMQLVEGYLIGLQLSDTQQILDLEPVSVGSILNDTAHQLSGLAAEHGLDMEIYIHGRQRLVMANAKALSTAFLNVGSTLIAMQPASPKRQVLTLVSYPRGANMIAGVYGNQTPISKQDWQRGQELYGRARQAIKTLNATNGAGLFVADTIFKAMASKLRPSHHRQQQGLAASLSLSQQLQLV